MSAKADVKRFQRLRCPKLKPSDFMNVNSSALSEMLVIAISGAGGYLETVNMITALPKAQMTTVLSLQAIPPAFAPTLSAYLNLRSRFEVQPFRELGLLNPGRCYIANCSMDMHFAISDGNLVLRKYSNGSDARVEDNIDRLLFSAAELFQERVVVMLLSGAELATMEGLQSVQLNGGKILSPRPERCILPASFEPAVEAGLIAEQFDPAELHTVLKRYCK